MVSAPNSYIKTSDKGVAYPSLRVGNKEGNKNQAEEVPNGEIVCELELCTGAVTVLQDSAIDSGAQRKQSMSGKMIYGPLGKQSLNLVYGRVTKRRC